MGGKTMKRKDQRWSNKGGKNWQQHKAYSSMEKQIGEVLAGRPPADIFSTKGLPVLYWINKPPYTAIIYA